jgi:hypothetical protein
MGPALQRTAEEALRPRHASGLRDFSLHQPERLCQQ